jgi:AAA+ superfamily predicted ATPase
VLYTVTQIDQIASECNAAMLRIKAADLLGTYVGDSEAALRAAFSKAASLVNPTTNTSPTTDASACMVASLLVIEQLV